jgi:hypothetical protein
LLFPPKIILHHIGSALAAWCSISGCAKSIEVIAGLSCALLPVPMIIVLMDWLLHTLVFKMPPDFSRIPDFTELPSVRLSALIALLAGWAVGVCTSGVIPGTEHFQVGICTLQAWLTGIAFYIPLRLLEYKREIANKRVSLENALLETIIAKNQSE